MIMLEVKDPAIRLFGRTIQRAANDDVSGLCYSAGSVSFHTTSSSSDDNNKNPGHCSSPSSSSSTKSSIISEVRRASSEEEQQEMKRIKKESKVQLACPRCNSSDTKFCYLNNYNAKQPRHFCKGCQRYWTAGGSMRTMAVGAGRRKLKSTASTITFQTPICSNPNFCHGFFPAAAAPYWVWIPPMEQRIQSSPPAEVLTPKTLRFDDARDVAKSSVWSTLGIKGQSLFGGFGEYNSKGGGSLDQRFRLANPAALSRSSMFREITADSEIKLGIIN